MIEAEKGSANIYSDLGVANAEEMLAKAQLATKIGDVIKAKQLPLRLAAETGDMSQAELSSLLHGQFRDISEAKMAECLKKLGQRYSDL